MTDQYGNAVDGEIYVPAKDFHDGGVGWQPITVDSWIQTYGVKDGSQKPPAPQATTTEYAIAYADGSVEEASDHEGSALQALQRVRRTLNGFGIPEEYHPVLMVRDVTTTYGSWRIRND